MNPQDEKWASLCPRCSREVSNKAYFAGPKGSAHFRGTCSFSTHVNLDRTVDKPMSPPSNKAELAYVNYNAAKLGNGPKADYFVFVVGDDCHMIQTYSDLAKWWGLPMIGEGNGKAKTKTKQSKAAKTLARMGITV